MDDLNEIRRRREDTEHMVPVFLVGFLLFGGGMMGGFINPAFGGIAGLLLCLTWNVFVRRTWVVQCPRCRCAYGRHKGPGSGSRTPNTCSRCGLRALTQTDFRRAHGPSESADGGASADEDDGVDD